jgi:hypothetical protein
MVTFLNELEEVVMGDAPPQIHVLDFNTITRTKLRGNRYHIAEDDSFTYCFDSTPLEGFANLARGALFLQYLQDPSMPRRDPPKPKQFALSRPRSLENGTSSWSFTFDPKRYKDESDNKRGILVVLVLPKGYTSPVFDFKYQASQCALYD